MEEGRGGALAGVVEEFCGEIESCGWEVGGRAWRLGYGCGSAVLNPLSDKPTLHPVIRIVLSESEMDPRASLMSPRARVWPRR